MSKLDENTNNIDISSNYAKFRNLGPHLDSFQYKIVHWLYWLKHNVSPPPPKKPVLKCDGEKNKNTSKKWIIWHCNFQRETWATFEELKMTEISYSTRYHSAIISRIVLCHEIRSFFVCKSHSVPVILTQPSIITNMSYFGPL